MLENEAMFQEERGRNIELIKLLEFMQHNKIGFESLSKFIELETADIKTNIKLLENK